MKTIDIPSENGKLTYFWEEGAGSGKKPLIVCLASGEGEARESLALVFSQANGASAAALVVNPQTQERDVGDWLYTLRQREDVDETRVTLMGAISAADWVWRLGSHFPQWFAGICAVGGHGDPYEVRAMKDIPVRAYPVKEEPLILREGKAAVDVERLVMGLLTAGSEHVQMRDLYEEDPWVKAVREDEAVSWLLEQDRRRQFQVMWLKPGVWRIDDWFSSSCYLIEGRDKALLVDTGLGEGDLAGLVASLTNLPVEVAITHPHGDHMHWVDSFERVYLHKEDIALMRETPGAFPTAFRCPETSHTEFVPIEEGAKLDLGDVEVEVWELPGHTPHSVIFVDHTHKCVFTGDAIGSGYIVLLICPERQAMELVVQYRESLMKIVPRLPSLRDYAWLGGHGIQENSCDPRHQQDYLAGASQYFNPIRPQVVQDMVCLCDDVLSGKIPWKSVLDSPFHYCSVGSAGIFFRFL